MIAPAPGSAGIPAAGSAGIPARRLGRDPDPGPTAVPGPPELGRGVVVGPGDGVPPAWTGAPEVLVDDAAAEDPSGVVPVLHAAWARREPVIVRLATDPASFRRPRTYDAEPWTLDAGFEVWGDRLQFLVWANNYDARAGSEPVWWWARKAVRLGADPGGPADVRLPDGTPAWADGGPRTPIELGTALVHRESIERGRLSVARPLLAPADGLAPDQLAAVAHPGGPARIVAPAGSGKTRVLTARLRHLLVARGWERDAVLAVAYNKKAQVELDARCADFAPRTRTLNSLGLSILTRATGSPPTVLDARDLRSIVERLMPPTRRRANVDPVEPYLEALGSIRLGLRDPEEVEGSRDDVPGLAALWPAFREALAERNAVDFDEQIYGAVERLLRDGERRADEQARCRHLLVDELQDLTPAHVLLLRLLAAPVLDCFGVGDDDQVIYGHAGADPGFLIDYGNYWPQAGDHPLEVNYRCPAAVVDAAKHLLSYNRRRVTKTIRAAKAPDGESRLATVVHPPGGGAAEAARIVGDWVRAGVAPASIAVLSRVNSLLLAPHVALAEAGLPFDSVVRPDILRRTGLRAALAYLRIATAPDSQIASGDVVEVLRRPSRGLPPWFADRIRRRSRWAVAGLRGIIDAVPEKDSPKVEALVGDLVALREAASKGAGAGRLLRLIRVDIGLGGAMGLLDRSKGGEGSSHEDDLEALEQVARLHDDPATLEAWIVDHLGASGDPNGVVLSTVHRVKGMEWDRVVVYGVTAGIVPHRLAEDEEEERRVLHVAITRCREEVAVLVDKARPSPFVDELTGAAPHRVRPARKPEQPTPAAVAAAVGDPVLEESLREWRRKRAAQDGVPAYIVFGNKTLAAIAASRPASLRALRAVEGIGPTKLELYGEEILALVAAASQ